MAETAADILRRYVERIERLEEEKRALAKDIAEIYKEAKGNGFDPKVMRKVVAERRRSAADVEEEQALIDTYKVSLGMLRDTPLGDAAVRAAKKDHGRAAPRAAGNDAGVSSPSAPAEVSARPATNQASPDLTDPERHQRLIAAGFIHLGGNEYEAPGKSADEPPDIPQFLDRRAKQADIEEYMKAAAE